ncbi:MAG: aminopeptidase P family protein [Eubacterium sp.]|nr:aminopeptidase P family protein [Eubacterium sp.]
MKEYASRLMSRLQSTEKSEKADAVYITDPYNMRYISGFAGGEGALLITQERCVLITDSRYTEAAQNESDFEVIEESRKHRREAILQEICQQQAVQHIAYEDLHLTCAAFAKLRKALPEISSWIPAGEEVNHLRRVKTAEEIALLQRAEAIGDAAFEDLRKILKTGMTELEVAAELEYFMKKHGAERLSFETIVASGPNSSMPHAVPTDRKIQRGDFLTMDFGCCYHGYCSDMTRTVAFGGLEARQTEIYETVLQAQKTALAVIRAGITGEEADRAARDIIEGAGYGECFGHSLGHSVGLYIHEDPRLAPGAEDVLEPGMAVTVEPGIYLPGYCGVRIEDLVIVTEDGCRNLTSSPKELLIFD